MRLFYLFGFGLILRLKPNSFDRGYPWDEVYYVPAIQQLRQGQTLLTDHPPLGKVLLALGAHWHDLIGARLLAMTVGALLPVLVGLILFRLSGRQRPALLGAMLVCLDTYLLAESRYALLNPLLCGVLLLALLAALQLPSRWRTLSTGLLAGFAIGIKWIALPLLPVLAWLQGSWRRGLAVAAIAALAYYLACAPVTQLQLQRFLAYQPQLLNYHHTLGRNHTVRRTEAERRSALKQHDNNGVRTAQALQRSSAYGRLLEWAERRQPMALDNITPVPFWPLGSLQLYSWSGAGKLQLVLAAYSNPAIWMGSAIGGIRQLWQRQHRWLGVAFLLCWLPWIAASRPLYPYTYEPALLLGAIALALQLDQGLTQGPRARRLLIGGYLSLAILYFFCHLPYAIGFGFTRLP